MYFSAYINITPLKLSLFLGESPLFRDGKEGVGKWEKEEEEEKEKEGWFPRMGEEKIGIAF